MLQRNFILFMLIILGGCTKDMAIQNKLIFQTYLAPQAPAGTISTSGQDATGAADAQLVTPTINLALLKRGQERYNISCTPCHDRTGSGNGLVVQRGFPRPVSFADQTNLSDQQIYQAMTDGYKTMAGYRTFVSSDDRIAIVAYVRVLQLARNFPAEYLDAADRAQLDKSGASK